MILHGQKKKVLKEVIRYYVDTTGNAYEDLILSVQKSRAQITDGMKYSDWLAVKCFEILSQSEISLADCVENKDIIRSAIKEDESRKDGEFYTPEVWAIDGRDYLKKMLGEQWGKAYIWEASCGTGNLIKGMDYPQDKIFMSTLLPEDIQMVQAILPDITAFPCNFVNDLDIDQYNKRFSEKLPPELIKVLENNEPLVFFMNPPYKVMEASSSDVGAYMASQGMAKCALDIFNQFMYRIIMLKRFYNLTNVYLGIFGPITLFHSKMLEDLYKEFKEDFVYVDGMCFTAGDFSNTSESVDWIIGYTTWKTKLATETDRSVVLDAKTADIDGNISTIGKRLVTNVDENLHNWCYPKDVIRSTMAPMVSNISNFTGTMYKFAENALGCIMSSNFVIRATRRACITSLPNSGGIDITEENFWRCVGSYGARRCYASRQNPYNNCQYYSKPDINVDGYNQWLVDALMLFLFDYNSQIAAYRDKEVEGKIWNVPNKLYPIDFNIVKQVVTDKTLLEDMEKVPPQNQFLVNILAQIKDMLSPEAMEFYQFCLEILLASLQGDTRERIGYVNWTNAWDASLIQLRSIDGFFTQEQEERYSYLLARLKDKLHDGIYKYGFMMDTAFNLGSCDITEDADENEENEEGVEE